MATQLEVLPILPPIEDYKPLGNGRSVLPYLLRLPNGSTFIVPYYPGMLAIQELRKQDPTIYGLTTSGIDEMTEKVGITPDAEGTLTVVLFPDKSGNLSPRYRTQNGKPLSKYRHPMRAENFTVTEGGQYKFETTVRELNPYQELEEALELLKGKKGDVFIHGWVDCLPTAFSMKPNEKFNNAITWIDPRFDYDFGERPLGRGGWILGPRERRFDTNLDGGPSGSSWRFRLGRTVDESLTEDLVKVPRTELERMYSVLGRLLGKQ